VPPFSSAREKFRIRNFLKLKFARVAAKLKVSDPKLNNTKKVLSRRRRRAPFSHYNIALNMKFLGGDDKVVRYVNLLNIPPDKYMRRLNPDQVEKIKLELLERDGSEPLGHVNPIIRFVTKPCEVPGQDSYIDS
jgi:hypothetical protein